MVRLCRKNGINNVFISSLVCRPTYQNTIDEVIRILKLNAETHRYIFIDNFNITNKHLYKDGTHLNKTGLNILANNFLRHLSTVCK